MKKILLLLSVLAMMATSCTEVIPLGTDLVMVHNRWHDVYGIEFAGKMILPMEYDSIVSLRRDDADFIAYKDGKAELWDYELTNVPSGPADYYYSGKGAYDHLGTPVMTKLAESPYMYEQYISYAGSQIILVNQNGKKSVYGYKDPYAPYDEIYLSVDGNYITEKNGLLGYCGVAPVYKKVYICKMQSHYYYLTSEDGINCDVTFYPHGKKKVRRNVITVADVEEFRDLDAKYVASEYSFEEFKDSYLGNDFYWYQLAGEPFFGHKVAVKKRANRRGNQ